MAKKITVIDRQSLDALRPQLEAILAPAAKKLGLAVSFGGGTFGGATGSLKLQLAVVAEGDEGKDADTLQLEAFWKKNVSYFPNLKPAWLGKSFKTPRGERAKIIGLRNGKRPVVVQVEGKQFVYPAAAIATMMAAKKAAAARS